MVAVQIQMPLLCRWHVGQKEIAATAAAEITSNKKSRLAGTMQRFSRKLEVSVKACFWAMAA